MAEWEEAWNVCGYSTYFHSPEWAAIWQKYSKERVTPKPLMINFSDGKRAVLPMSAGQVCKGFVTEYILSPGGTFGGWISVDQLTEDHALQLSVLIAKRCKQLSWRLNPYDPLVAESVKLNVKQDETHVLDLADGFGSIFKLWSKGHKSAAKKAHREGVIVREAISLEEWQAYFTVYEDSLRRWGDKASSKYSWRLFEDLYRRKSSNIKLWLSFYNEQVISGMLCFYAKNHVVYWHGAALEEYFGLRPVHWGVHEVVRSACESDYRWFDFNPSGTNEGVKKFKKGFGATSRAAPVVLVSHWGVKAARGLVSRFRG